MPTVILPGGRRTVTEATTIPDIREMPEGLMEGILETPEVLMEDILEMPGVLTEDIRDMPMILTEETAQVRTENRTEAIFLRNQTAATEEAAVW